jgi:hypothetical protein
VGEAYKQLDEPTKGHFATIVRRLHAALQLIHGKFGAALPPLSAQWLLEPTVRIPPETVATVFAILEPHVPSGIADPTHPLWRSVIPLFPTNTPVIHDCVNLPPKVIHTDKNPPIVIHRQIGSGGVGIVNTKCALHTHTHTPSLSFAPSTPVFAP